MNIRSSNKEYYVVMESDLSFIEQLVHTENAEFIIDQNVYHLYCNSFVDIPENRLLLVEATEENKVIQTALAICEKITEIPAKRNATIISIGGGIIQDITGFVANITYRGIHWIFVPTTLLSACDSCIGGKTSLNYKSYKNLLGTFYAPDVIHICPDFFGTLTERDYMSGLGEVIKFNIMTGECGISNVEANIQDLLNRKKTVINHFVESSLLFKKKYIEIDEFDWGERVKLNFAHTFGHAIEVVSKYEIPHGTAVAIGMIIADYIAYKRGYVSQEIIKRAERLLLQVIKIDSSLLVCPIKQYLDVIRKDKKQIDSNITTVLFTEYKEKPELTVVHDTTEQEIQEGIAYFIDLYKAGER